MYLIDSDYLIDFLNEKAPAIEILKQINDEPLYTSVINVGEILEGLQEPTPKNKIRKDNFKQLLQTMTVIDLNRLMMEKFADIKYELRRRGKLIDNFDLLIASTCLAHQLILVTNNKKHFSRIAKLKIYND